MKLYTMKQENILIEVTTGIIFACVRLSPAYRLRLRNFVKKTSSSEIVKNSYLSHNTLLNLITCSIACSLAFSTVLATLFTT